MYALNQRGAINAGETVLSALIVTPVVFLNLVVMLRLAQRFERWVRRPAAV